MTTDPFDSLREPNVPLAPRPAFAAELRRRVSLALGATRETEEEIPMPEVREFTPARLHSITPYLATNDPAAAIDWYTEVFGARLLGDPIVMPDGTIGHAELRIGDSVITLNDALPQFDSRAPDPDVPVSVSLTIYCEDADALYAQAVAAGATSVGEPSDAFFGDRVATVRDPFGHKWAIATHLRDMTSAELEQAMQEAFA